MNYLCYLFGHTGNFTESGYHVCSRCGLHEYWSSRQVDSEAPIDYDNAGHVYRLVIWPIRDWWEGLPFHHRNSSDSADDLPF
jgi:hypothetical protein